MRSRFHRHDAAPHDYIVVARRIIERATGEPIRPSFAAGSRPGQTVFASVLGCMAERMNLRVSTQATGLPRNEIRSVIQKLGNASRAWMDHQLCGFQSTDPKLIQTRVFEEKFRQGHTYPGGLVSVWTQLAIDPPSGLIYWWRTGPFLPDIATELKENPRIAGSDAAWLEHLPPGLARKFGNHAAAFAVFCLYHNFCAQPRSRNPAPAVVAGIATAVMTPEEAASTALGSEFDGQRDTVIASNFLRSS